MKMGGLGQAVGAVVGGVLLCSPAFAQVQFPKIARGYATWMARAMDQCNPAAVSVVGTGVPSNGCIQANTTTDDQVTMSLARVSVSPRTGRVLVFGRGFHLGARIALHLTLRTTQANVSISHPARTKVVTFEDHVVTCPNSVTSPFGFISRPSGSLLGAVKLVDCLGSGVSGLAKGNVEIVDAALINIDTGKVFARPGIER